MQVPGRAALACLSCRKGKARCGGTVPSAIASPSSKTLDAVPADLPCSRCQRLGLDCTWRPVNRTGRPKKTDKTTLHSPSSAMSTSTVSPSPPLQQDIDLFTDQDLFHVFASSFGQGTPDANGLTSLFTFPADEGSADASFADATTSRMQVLAPALGNSKPISMQLKQCEQRIEQYQPRETLQPADKMSKLG